MSEISLPDFDITPDEIPSIRIKSIHFKNYKAFEDVYFDFTDNGIIKPFICFHGPNGCGKSTILDTITLILSRLEGREEEKLKALLGKSVRHVDGLQNGVYGNEDFLITSKISSNSGDYEIQINKSGFIKNHPEEIREYVYRLYYMARFDQELYRFQLNKDKWNVFKELFEAVTGFTVEQKTNIFDKSDDPVQKSILDQYIMGFWIHKPDEIISQNECSAGERKIIKSFSTLLNKEYMPSIVCIDNAEMHVESGRHIQLIESMKKCFPNSQIFATTHSYQISKNFGDKLQLYDLRLLKSSDLIKKEQWRLYLADEIRDSIFKLQSIKSCKEINDLIGDGKKLLAACYDDSFPGLINSSKFFIQKVSDFFIEDIVLHYNRRDKNF